MQNDSITLLLQSDCCNDLNPAIIVKDSGNRTMIRRFEMTETIAVKDILRYITKEKNIVWLLYTEKDAEKDGTIVWDIESTYPRKRGYPRLRLTITE
jgi:hypothetical protein